MRAVVLNSFTGVAGLELSAVADPTPADGEELVYVRAASLGPWDRAAADGAFAGMGGATDFPQVQGWDFAGETVDGRRVLGFVAQPWMGVGTLAEPIAVPSAILAPLPDSLGFPEGSALPVCVLTAGLLADAAAVSEGDLVLVTGAAGWLAGSRRSSPADAARESLRPCATPTQMRRAGWGLRSWSARGTISRA
jgi:NADPH:quinone reductase-like Zn-dependent oxidoreductase